MGTFVEAMLAGLASFLIYLHIGERIGRSLVVSDASGARHVHTDVGGIADATQPPELFDKTIAGCDLAVLANVAYTRPPTPTGTLRQ